MKKIVLWSLGGLIAIGVIGSLTSSADKPEGTSAPTEESIETTTTEGAAKKWVKVTELSGTSEKTGDTFHLSGGQARLTYDLSTEGALSVYVVDEGDSLEKSGGFPVASCFEKCKDSTRLVKDQGDYYLTVNASGTWKVVVEEYR